MITIRLAVADDLEAINAIYNYYVPRSTCTYQTEAETIEARRAWFENHGPAHPIIVAVGDAGEIAGWGSLSRFHSRQAYARTVENSVYVRHDRQRQGVGKRILHDLIVRATSLGHHVIIAGIDAEQEASVALHRSAGFIQVAHLREVGFKFERWLDVIYMQKTLGRDG